MSDSQNLGLEGEECRSCRAPLAADQRYCLNCGRRRGASRVDLEALGAGDAASAAGGEAAPPGGPPAPPNAAWTPMTIVGGIAVLAVVLLVGVMLGNDKQQDPVQVAAAPVAAAAPTTTAATDKGGAKVASTDTGGGKSSGGAKSSGGGKDKVVPATSAPGAQTLTPDQLNALDQASGADYAKQSKNLPDTIALPGEPPPKDNKDPGGGTSVQVIK